MSTEGPCLRFYHRENVLETFSFTVQKKMLVDGEGFKTEVASRKDVSLRSSFCSSHNFSCSHRWQNFIKLLPEFIWILTKEPPVCLLPTQRVRSEREGFSFQPHSNSLFFGTKLYIYLFTAILNPTSYLTLEALAVVLFKPDKDFQLSGLRREPSKLSSTNSARTE